MYKLKYNKSILFNTLYNVVLITFNRLKSVFKQINKNYKYAKFIFL